MLTCGIPPDFRGRIHCFFEPPYAIGRVNAPRRSEHPPVRGENVKTFRWDHVCVCVCVCCHPIYYGRQTCGRTSRSHTGRRSHRISPPSFCGACLNLFSREGFGRPFPSSTVMPNFVYPRINRSRLVEHILFIYIFCEEKSQFVSPEFIVSRNCVATAFAAESPPAQGQ